MQRRASYATLVALGEVVRSELWNVELKWFQRHHSLDMAKAVGLILRAESDENTTYGMGWNIG